MIQIRPSTAMVTLVSFALTAMTVFNAYLVKKQFYPAVVYMAKSNAALAVLYLQAVVLGYLAFQLLRNIFFGQLRAAESEHINERLWHAVMETALAFTVFRDDLTSGFALQFLLLLFVKCFHWLSEDRVDYMERSPIISITFHVRIISLLALLSLIDSHCISTAFFQTMTKGITAQVVFGFEYAVMMTMVIHVAIKYILHMHDLRSQHPWENKAVYLLYAELFINAIRFLLYFAFAASMWKAHAVPLFAIRPFYMTLRSLHKAVNDVILSRRAIYAMNNLFPLATEEDLAQGDNTCIICREEMTVLSGAKKLPCNHIFHPNCLRSWFQRQQTCPTCRTDILADQQQRRPNVVPQNVAAGGGGAQINGFRVNIAANQGGNVPPMFFPLMAHQFAFPAPAQAAPPPGAAPAAPGQPAPAGGEQQQQQGQHHAIPQPQQMPQMPQMPGMMPPFMPPPFMMPPPPPPPAFPQPPSFNGMSDEELRALEGTERAAIEERIQTLRNIACLLDAAMYQFAQYSAITSAASATTAHGTAQSAPAPDAAEESPAPAETNQPEEESDDEIVVPPLDLTSHLQPQPAASSEGTVETAPAEPKKKYDIKLDTEELRRRRVERLGKNPSCTDLQQSFSSKTSQPHPSTSSES